MKTLPFNKKFDKLLQDAFVAWRFPREENDWQVGELVEVEVYPRREDKEALEIAEVIDKKLCEVSIYTMKAKTWNKYELEGCEHTHMAINITDNGFIAEFDGQSDMFPWMNASMGRNYVVTKMYKLTLRWLLTVSDSLRSLIDG